MTSTTENPRHDHERKDVDVVSLFTIVFLLLLSGVVIFFVVTGLMHLLKLHASHELAGTRNIPVATTKEFPAPRLEVIVSEDLAKLRAAEEADLNSYGWVDYNAGIVRVPIDRAMQMLLHRGLPDVGAGQTPLSLMQARPSESATPPRLMEKK